MKDRKKLVKEFGLFVVGVLFLLWITPVIILSSEDKVSQYVACEKNGGVDSSISFSNEIECKDGSKQLWK